MHDSKNKYSFIHSTILIHITRKQTVQRMIDNARTSETMDITSTHMMTTCDMGIYQKLHTTEWRSKLTPHDYWSSQLHLQLLSKDYSDTTYPPMPMLRYTSYNWANWTTCPRFDTEALHWKSGFLDRESDVPATAPLRHCATVPLCHCATAPLCHSPSVPAVHLQSPLPSPCPTLMNPSIQEIQNGRSR